MTTQAYDLFRESKISFGQYKTFLLFEENEDGFDWLKRMCECIYAERVPPIGDHAYAWQDGRISLLRDIKQMITDVKDLLLVQQETEKTN